MLLATDCNPKWLTKHIPVISASRNVPVLALKDNKGSSLRLGELVNVRTALAIGIKVGNSHLILFPTFLSYNITYATPVFQ